MKLNLFRTISSHLFDCSQDLADLKDLIHFTVSGEKRSESVKFSHDASDGPQVNRGAVSGRSQQDLRSSVPGGRERHHVNQTKTHTVQLH